MSNKGIIIEERSRDIGDFLVGRLLPFRKKRMVGPFVFIDHMGPTEITSNYLDIDQHPHIGLSTLTYLFEGEIMHRDSIGSHQKIIPGAVNFMTSGKGVVHTERTPQKLRNGRSHRVHGFQIWVALPKHLEDMEPHFQHLAPEELPFWQTAEASFKLIAGEAFGKKAPLKVYSDLFLLEIKTTQWVNLALHEQLSGEIGICVVEGNVKASENTITAGSLLVTKNEDLCHIEVEQDSHLLVFGGTPFREERHIYWNFVSSDLSKIEQAKDDWRNEKFQMISGEKSYIRLPE